MYIYISKIEYIWTLYIYKNDSPNILDFKPHKQR